MPPVPYASDSDLSASVGGTEFTLPQQGSLQSSAQRVPGFRGFSDVGTGAGSSVSQVNSGANTFAFDSDDDDEAYEMPSLEAAAKESRQRSTGGAGPSGVGKGPGGKRPGGRGGPTSFDFAESVVGSSLAPASSLTQGSNSNAGSYLLPDVNTATTAIYAGLKAGELEETLALQGPAGLDREGSALSVASGAELESFPKLKPPPLSDSLLNKETQATGQALAKRVLSRLRKERGETETGEKMRDTQRSLRRFRAVVRQVIASRAFKTVEELRTLPTPISVGTIRGYIVVEPQDKMNRGTLFGGESPIYKYFVQSEVDTMEDRFVMCAKKDFSDPLKTQFIMSTDPTNIEDVGPHYFGRMSGNFMGSKYTMFDRGSMQPTIGSVLSEAEERRVLGAVVYEGTLGKTTGSYRRLTALLPNTYRGKGKDGEQRVLQWDEMKDLRDMHILTTKTPNYKKIDGRWCYCYKWGGRVKMPSTKNFQLVLHGNQDAVVVLFGKIDKNLYALDFTSPLSAHQAFCIALSSLDQKLCMAL